MPVLEGASEKALEGASKGALIRLNEEARRALIEIQSLLQLYSGRKITYSEAVVIAGMILKKLQSDGLLDDYVKRVFE